jgi:hypothetical protein
MKGNTNNKADITPLLLLISSMNEWKWRNKLNGSDDGTTVSLRRIITTITHRHINMTYKKINKNQSSKEIIGCSICDHYSSVNAVTVDAALLCNDPLTDGESGGVINANRASAAAYAAASASRACWSAIRGSGVRFTNGINCGPACGRNACNTPISHIILI